MADTSILQIPDSVLAMAKKTARKFDRSLYPYSCANNRGKQWSLEEDSLIMYLVSVEGPKQWTHFADVLHQKFAENSYTGKQIRERFQNHLNPNVNKGEWSTSEEALML
jgi:hypothetical protein